MARIYFSMDESKPLHIQWERYILFLSYTKG